MEKQVTNRTTNFLEFFSKTLKEAIKKESFEALGDRKSYVGSSDIGGCLRKAYLSKFDEESITLNQAIIFQRGHIVETILKKGLGNLPYKEQVEVNDGAFSAHIDFLINNNKENELIIIEVKSFSSTELKNPYDSWILQVQFQIALLKKKYPNKKIDALIVAINPNGGEVKIFSVSPNVILQDLALKKADELLKSIKQKQEPKAEPQLYCVKCKYRMSCPVFAAGEIPAQMSEELKKEVETIAHLQTIQKETEKMLSEKKGVILDFLNSLNIKQCKTENHSLRIQGGGQSTTLDTKALQETEPEVYQDLIAQYQKTTTKTTYLVVR